MFSPSLHPTISFFLATGDSAGLSLGHPFPHGRLNEEVDFLSSDFPHIASHFLQRWYVAFARVVFGFGFESPVCFLSRVSHSTTDALLPPLGEEASVSSTLRSPCVTLYVFRVEPCPWYICPSFFGS